MLNQAADDCSGGQGFRALNARLGTLLLHRPVLSNGAVFAFRLTLPRAWRHTYVQHLNRLGTWTMYSSSAEPCG